MKDVIYLAIVSFLLEANARKTNGKNGLTISAIALLVASVAIVILASRFVK